MYGGYRTPRGSFEILTSPPQARELLQLISEGFLFMDGDFRIQEISAEGLRLANRGRDDIVGGILWDQAPGLRESELGKRLIEAAGTRKPVSFEHHYAWPHGRQAWLEVRAFPTEGGLAVFYRDITGHKQSEDELKQAQSELMHASRLSAMGTMAATLAHELAQPLTSATNAIDAGTKMLKLVSDPKAREARKALSMAGDAIARAGDLLRRMRSFVAKGRTEASTQDLAAIIADASVLMFPLAQRAGVEIDYKLDRRAQWVMADGVQIQQVLINLLRNAIEAIGSSDERKIAVSTEIGPGHLVKVSVQDTGPGLDEATARALFEPFNSSKQQGLGVGLSICRTIIEAHGGRIRSVPSEMGGAKFEIILPRPAVEDE